MSSISVISTQVSIARAWQAGGMVRISAAANAQADNSSPSFEFDPIAASLDAALGLGVDESLTRLQARLDASIVASNALATAAGAITKIGNAIGTIQSVLNQSPTLNPAATDTTPANSQSTIDKALQSIDSISASSKFLGGALLDGTYAGAGQTIPPLTTQTLGIPDSAGALDASATLHTLLSGGPNDLASGNVAGATAIADSASQQVGSVAQLVDSLRAVSAGAALLGVESGATWIDANRAPGIASAMALAQQAATIMLGDPRYGSAAVANASADHVVAMIQNQAL